MEPDQTSPATSASSEHADPAVVELSSEQKLFWFFGNVVALGFAIYGEGNFFRVFLAVWLLILVVLLVLFTLGYLGKLLIPGPTGGGSVYANATSAVGCALSLVVVFTLFAWVAPAGLATDIVEIMNELWVFVTQSK